MRSVFISLSVVLALASNVAYIASILKGESKPHRTTRFVLFFIELLTFSTLVAQHSTTTIWLSGFYAAASLVLFLLSVRYGMGGWEKSDLLCLGIAFAGIVFWKVTSNPFTGLLFSISADFAGCVPALIKTYKYPETESWTFYGIGILAILCNMAAITNWVVSEYLYLVYILGICTTMLLFIFRKRIQQKLVK